MMNRENSQDQDLQRSIQLFSVNENFEKNAILSADDIKRIFVKQHSSFPEQKSLYATIKRSLIQIYKIKYGEDQYATNIDNELRENSEQLKKEIKDISFLNQALENIGIYLLIQDSGQDLEDVYNEIRQLSSIFLSTMFQSSLLTCSSIEVIFENMQDQDPMKLFKENEINQCIFQQQIREALLENGVAITSFQCYCLQKISKKKYRLWLDIEHNQNINTLNEITLSAGRRYFSLQFQNENSSQKKWGQEQIVNIAVIQQVALSLLQSFRNNDTLILQVFGVDLNASNTQYLRIKRLQRENQKGIKNFEMPLFKDKEKALATTGNQRLKLENEEYFCYLKVEINTNCRFFKQQGNEMWINIFGINLNFLQIHFEKQDPLGSYFFQENCSDSIQNDLFQENTDSSITDFSTGSEEQQHSQSTNSFCEKEIDYLDQVLGAFKLNGIQGGQQSNQVIDKFKLQTSIIAIQKMLLRTNYNTYQQFLQRQRRIQDVEQMKMIYYLAKFAESIEVQLCFILSREDPNALLNSSITKKKKEYYQNVIFRLFGIFSNKYLFQCYKIDLSTEPRNQECSKPFLLSHFNFPQSTLPEIEVLHEDQVTKVVYFSFSANISPEQIKHESKMKYSITNCTLPFCDKLYFPENFLSSFSSEIPYKAEQKKFKQADQHIPRIQSIRNSYTEYPFLLNELNDLNLWDELPNYPLLYKCCDDIGDEKGNYSMSRQIDKLIKYSINKSENASKNKRLDQFFLCFIDPSYQIRFSQHGIANIPFQYVKLRSVFCLKKNQESVCYIF